MPLSTNWKTREELAAMYPDDPFQAAWAYYQQLQHIIPPNDQSFRHGWNAALMAAAAMFRADDSQRYGWTADHEAIARGLLKLEVEVKT